MPNKSHCKIGQILKKGYYRKKSSRSKTRTRVSSTCIKNRGNPLRGPKFLKKKLEKGKLGRFGYHNVIELKDPTRHRRLKKAIKAYGFREVISRLNVIANLSNYSNPKTANIIRQDQQWVSKKYDEWKRVHHTIQPIKSKKKI